MRIYCGNLPYTATREEVEELFAAHGTVNGVDLMIDRDTNRSRGFAFVDMNDEEGKTAIDALDNHPFGGRNLRVNEARPRQERPRRGGGRRDRDFW